MEGLSKDMLLERMEEEYDSMHPTADSSASSSSSTSKQVECLGHYVPFIRQHNQVRPSLTLCNSRFDMIVTQILDWVS